MPLVAGSVTINGLGVSSGTGLAKLLYDALESGYGITPAQVPTSVPGAQEQLAVMANKIGQVVIAYVLANAVITVPSGIPVATTGTAAAQAGTTTAPSIAVLT